VSDSAAFLHHAFFYDDVDHYVDVITGFVELGLDAGSAVLVAVPTPRVAALRDCGWVADPQVQLLDMVEIGRNPGRIISVWQEFVGTNGEAGRTIRGVGEPIWAGRSAAELVECQWHESLLNLAFDGDAGFPLMCPYDAAALDPAVVEAARRTHPFIYGGGGVVASTEFDGVPASSDHVEVPLAEPAGEYDTLAFGMGGLAAVRHLAYAQAVRAGLRSHRVADFLVAVNEVATNSLRHGGGHGVMRLWRTPSTVVCEVRDEGRIAQALVGRTRTSLHATNGRGLWLVHQLCDLVELRSSAHGTTVRMSMSLAD